MAGPFQMHLSDDKPTTLQNGDIIAIYRSAFVRILRNDDDDYRSLHLVDEMSEHGSGQMMADISFAPAGVTRDGVTEPVARKIAGLITTLAGFAAEPITPPARLRTTPNREPFCYKVIPRMNHTTPT